METTKYMKWNLTHKVPYNNWLTNLKFAQSKKLLQQYVVASENLSFSELPASVFLMCECHISRIICNLNLFLIFCNLDQNNSYGVEAEDGHSVG